MDLRAMTVVARAVTIERLTPAGERVARAIGALIVPPRGNFCSVIRNSSWRS